MQKSRPQNKDRAVDRCGEQAADSGLRRGADAPKPLQTPNVTTLDKPHGARGSEDFSVPQQPDRFCQQKSDDQQDQHGEITQAPPLPVDRFRQHA